MTISADRAEPPRVWVYRDDYHYPKLYGGKHPCRPSTEYIRADLVRELLEALAPMEPGITNVARTQQEYERLALAIIRIRASIL